VRNAYGNESVQGLLGIMDRTGSQNLSLDSPSVWGAKSDEFRREMKDSMGSVGIYGMDGVAEFELKSALSTESKK